jgi:hypothetical protein
MPSDLLFEAATAATEPKLRKLLRENPLSGEINVSLEREPNAFHAARTSGDEFQLMLAFAGDEQQVIGSGGRFELTAYINGTARQIGYFGELRADGGLRQRRRLMLGSYRKMRQYHESGNVPYYLTTIVADNTAARRLLEAGLGDMPTYQPLESIVTFTIPARAGARRRRSSRRIEHGTDSQLGVIADAIARHGPNYQFHPVWTEQVLRSKDRCRGLGAEDYLLCRDGEQLLGCLALWDQRSFKQTVIRGYSKRLARARPLLNVAAPLLSRPRLPSPGSRLESAFLSHVAVAPDDEQTLVALVGRACKEALARELDYVMIAFAERNPLADVIRRRFPCHKYVSMIYVVYWEDGATAANQLDDRIPHPEVAIL